MKDGVVTAGRNMWGTCHCVDFPSQLKGLQSACEEHAKENQQPFSHRNDRAGILLALLIDIIVTAFP
ncbi:mCG147568 [Mus musculus]|jgi:hypothetical protein|nr:mCG147568 [Mus musculus]